MHGAPARVGAAKLLADNGAVHGEILELFSEIFAGRHRVPLPQINPA
jgi:hypothetical protein